MTLMSRVKKDELFWLYKHAEEALVLDAASTDRVPLDAFEIPVRKSSHLQHRTGESDGQFSSYEALAQYFAQVKRYLTER
eukprot:SAG31_NODE_42955_length_269_cov_0.694118_1_plen_79_part_10